MTITVHSNGPSQAQLDSNPHCQHIWGENLGRYGDNDGAAGHCRNRHNAIGLPVKRLPGNEANAFFTDKDLDGAARRDIDTCLLAAEEHLYRGGEVAWPADLGRTELAGAPALLAYLQERLNGMMQRYGVTAYQMAA